MRADYDAVLKDIFQQNQPTVWSRLTGGLAVEEVVSGEFQEFQLRRADLVARLSNGELFHIEFQSENDKDMPYRMGMYCLLIAQRHRSKVRQVVLYIGPDRMNMEESLDLGVNKVGYRLVDIREFQAEELIQSSNPGDLILAILARNGAEQLAEIARRACAFTGPARKNVITQLAILSGLRRLSSRLKMDLRRAGAMIDIQENEILRDIFEEGEAKGRTEGRTEGRAEGRAEGLVQGLTEGMAAVVRDLLQAKFGPLPTWAEDRLARASAPQIERWAKRILNAETIESVLGKEQ